MHATSLPSTACHNTIHAQAYTFSAKFAIRAAFPAVLVGIVHLVARRSELSAHTRRTIALPRRHDNRNGEVFCTKSCTRDHTWRC